MGTRPPLALDSAEHVGRLLNVASCLIRRGRLNAACDVLELAEAEEPTPGQLAVIGALAFRICLLARQRQRPPQPVAPLAPVLPFRARLAIAAPRSAAV